MHYIIDGYNLLKSGRLSLPRHLDLEGQRDHLLRLLASFAARGGARVTVVFDGASTGGGTAGGPVAVLFSRAGEEADDVIRQRIRKSRNPGKLTVVSTDRAIQNTAADHGAASMSSAEFCRMALAPREKAKGRITPREKHDTSLSDKEVAYWKDLFEKGPGHEDQ